jgi:hypothetical protein
MFVAGSSVFGTQDPAGAVKVLRDLAVAATAHRPAGGGIGPEA